MPRCFDTEHLPAYCETWTRQQQLSITQACPGTTATLRESARIKTKQNKKTRARPSWYFFCIASYRFLANYNKLPESITQKLFTLSSLIDLLLFSFVQIIVWAKENKSRPLSMLGSYWFCATLEAFFFLFSWGWWAEKHIQPLCGQMEFSEGGPVLAQSQLQTPTRTTDPLIRRHIERLLSPTHHLHICFNWVWTLKRCSFGLRNVYVSLILALVSH